MDVGGERGSGSAPGRGSRCDRARARAGRRCLLARSFRQGRVRGGEALGRPEHQALAVEVKLRSTGAGRRREPAPRSASLDVREPGIGDRLEREVARRSAGGVARQLARERRRPRPPRAPTPTTRRVGSVRVPVLSVHTTSTEASDSIAFSCWARTPRWAILNADTAAVRLTSRISPSGTRLDHPGGDGLYASRGSLVVREHGDREPDGERHGERDRTRPAAGRWRARGETAGGGRSGRSRSAARRGCPGPPPWPRTAPSLRPRTTPTTPVPRAPQHQLGLAGQVGLIQRQPVGRDDRSVGDHLIPGGQAHQVADHDVVDRHAAIGAVVAPRWLAG